MSARLALQSATCDFANKSSVVTFRFCCCVSMEFFSLASYLCVTIALREYVSSPSFMQVRQFRGCQFSNFLCLRNSSSYGILRDFLAAISMILNVRFCAGMNELTFICRGTYRVLGEVRYLTSFSSRSARVLAFGVRVREAIYDIMFQYSLRFSGVRKTRCIAGGCSYSLLGLSSLLQVTRSLCQSTLLQYSLAYFLQLALL